MIHPITFLTLLLLSCTTHKGNVFIMDNSYVGPVVIVFEQEISDSVILNNQLEKRFFVPSSGILEVKEQLEIGVQGMDKFYYVIESDSTEISQVFEWKDLDSTKTYVTGISVGKYYGTIDASNVQKNPISYGVFFVGTKGEVEQLSQNFDVGRYLTAYQ